MNINLKKEGFEEIEGAFRKILDGKNTSDALKTIKTNLKDIFDKDINIEIVDNKKSEFFIMSIFPEESTIDKIVEAIVKESSDDIIKAVWDKTQKWNIEIDSKILKSSTINANPKELTALLLHEIGHIVYSNSIPQRISRVMRLEYARASVGTKHLLRDKLFSQILRLPIINACLYDNYKTKDAIKKELKADFFVVKMGYGDDLEVMLNKLIVLSDDKARDVNKSSQKVYNDMKSMTLFSIETVEGFKERKVGVTREKFKRMMLTSPSKFVQDCLDKIQDTFLKGSDSTSVTESRKLEFIFEKANTLFEDGYVTEFFGSNKKLKRIDPADLDYIELERLNIKSNNDKMLLVSYVYSKLDMIRYYMSILDSKDANRYNNPHTKEELDDMRIRLEKLREDIIKAKIPKTKYGLYVTYPDGWDG